MFEEFEKKKREEKGSVLILLSCAALYTLFLFFIDEGYYNFEWAKDVFNWFMFVGFTGVFFLIQFALYKLLTFGFKKLNPNKYLVSVLLGCTMGTVLVFMVF